MERKISQFREGSLKRKFGRPLAVNKHSKARVNLESTHHPESWVTLWNGFGFGSCGGCILGCL